MGYTHYFYQENGPIAPEAWEKIRADVRKLFQASPCKLAEASDSPGEPPIASTRMIFFNGIPGHETFMLERAPPRTFAFCKTAQKPYDLVVVAVLCVVAEHAADKVRVLSDGGEEDWRQGLLWARAVLGREVPMPTLREEKPIA